MAHVSGNPVWQNKPNKTTPVTAGALESIEGAIDDLDTGKIPASRWLTGTGSPEGVITAAVGTVYTDEASGEEWHKMSGVDVTGWRGPVVLADDPHLRDTNWRVVTSWDDAGNITGDPLPEGITPRAGMAGSLMWRRRGEEVSLRLYACEVDSPSIPIPAGLRPSNTDWINAMMFAGADPLQVRVARFDLHVTGAALVERLYASEVKFTTSVPFPAEPYFGAPA